MPLEIVRGDIAEVEAEAAAVELSIAPGGRAKQMLDKMKESFGLDTPLEPGMADIELAKSGRTRFVIRAAIPKWQGGGAGEQDALARACANAMSLAREFGLRSVAFPLLGTESGYPEDLALRTEKAVLNVALVNDNMKIILVLAPDVGEA